MSTTTPEVKHVPTGTPPPSMAPTTRRRRWIWVAVVVALVVGAAAGYGLRWGTEPTKTVTQTVTNTVTEPAFTTSQNVPAQVVFDGKSCAYTGPNEVTAGTKVRFTYAAADSPQPSALVVWGTLPTTTYEVVRAYLGKPDSGLRPPFVGDYELSKPRGAAQQTLTMRLQDEGVYGVSCNTSPNSTNIAYYGTTIRVVP